MSEEFKCFTKMNGIKHLTSCPYHPASNGLTERAVKTFKNGLKKMSEGSVLCRLTRFLFSYRNTPQTTTGVAPAELLIGRRLRSCLDLLKPDLQAKVINKQQLQKAQHDHTSRHHEFSLNDPVFVRNFRPGPRWLPGTIQQKLGPITYLVKVSGYLWRRHLDHIHSQYTKIDSSTQSATETWSDTIPTAPEAPLSTADRRYPSRVRHPPDRLAY